MPQNIPKERLSQEWVLYAQLLRGHHWTMVRGLLFTAVLWLIPSLN